MKYIVTQNGETFETHIRRGALLSKLMQLSSMLHLINSDNKLDNVKLILEICSVSGTYYSMHMHNTFLYLNKKKLLFASPLLFFFQVNSYYE